jgi:hypothetical protein
LERTEEASVRHAIPAGVFEAYFGCSGWEVTMFRSKLLMRQCVPDVLVFRTISLDPVLCFSLSGYLSGTSGTSGTKESAQRVRRSGWLQAFRNVLYLRRPEGGRA